MVASLRSGRSCVGQKAVQLAIFSIMGFNQLSLALVDAGVAIIRY